MRSNGDEVISRRGLLAGLLATPAIVSVDSLMRLPPRRLVRAWDFASDSSVRLNHIALVDLPPGHYTGVIEDVSWRTKSSGEVLADIRFMMDALTANNARPPFTYFPPPGARLPM
jgi:hypothetical protein